MGCDIHLYIEVKNPEGIWEQVKVENELLPRDRHYRLFAFLADVRNSEYPIIKPQFADRGIPEDTSMPANDYEDFWIGEHSFTYAYLNEILDAPWKRYELEHSYFFIFCAYVLPRLLSWIGTLNEKEKRNTRIIMGFDN